MKIDDVVKTVGRPRTTREGVLRYLDRHDDQVFRMRQCDEIAEALGAPKRTVENVIWSLHHDGLIARARLGKEVWYGCDAAIEQLISTNPAAVRF